MCDTVTFQWLRWHPRGHLLLAGSEDSTVWMWNADRGAFLSTFAGHGGSVTCGDFTPDGSNYLHLDAHFPSLFSCYCSH